MQRFRIGQRWVPRHADGRYAIVIGVSDGGREGTLAVWTANNELLEKQNYNAAQFVIGWRLAS
jgi:hypothetical protein